MLKQLGPEHPYVARTYNNIGLVHDKKDEYDKALEHYQKALAIQLKQLGQSILMWPLATTTSERCTVTRPSTTRHWSITKNHWP